jgi:glycosyltransferase involved in cell wall biosynthesis
MGPGPRPPYHLLVLHLAGAIGGAEQTTSLILRHLHTHRIARVTLVGSEPLRPLLTPYCDRFIDGRALGLPFWFTDLPSLRRDAARAAEILAEHRPDVVLGMMHYGGALAAFAGRLSGHPLRTVASLRGPAYEYLVRYEPGVRRRLFLRAAIGATGWLADRVLVPSLGTGRELRRRFLVPPGRVEVIPNGIDQAAALAASREAAPDLQDLPAGAPVICAVARLSSEKDLGLLLEAFQRVHWHYPARLLVVGEGPDRPGLEAQGAALGLSDAIWFVGYRSNVFPYLARSDLFVHTCQFEGFGYTMLEAMACGVPVVATDCPYGPREVIGHGRCGVLVPPGDPEALASALLSLLRDPQRRGELAQNARVRAAALSLDRMMSRYVSVLGSLAAELAG